MKLLKLLFGIREEVADKKIITVTEDSEELANRLKEFDNQTLIKKVEVLERALTFLAKKIEVQSEVIRRQSDAVRDIHITIEEIANVFEAAQKAVDMKNQPPQHDEDDDGEEVEKEKKYLN
jgi:hypothetical protein